LGWWTCAGLESYATAWFSETIRYCHATAMRIARICGSLNGVPCTSFSLFRFYEWIGNNASARICIFSGNESTPLMRQCCYHKSCARILFPGNDPEEGTGSVIHPAADGDRFHATQASITITSHHSSRRVRCESMEFQESRMPGGLCHIMPTSTNYVEATSYPLEVFATSV
jgi:hypothetical protein